jgi:hypothetical protein
MFGRRSNAALPARIGFADAGRTGKELCPQITQMDADGENGFYRSKLRKQRFFSVVSVPSGQVVPEMRFSSGRGGTEGNEGNEGNEGCKAKAISGRRTGVGGWRMEGAENNGGTRQSAATGGSLGLRLSGGIDTLVFMPGEMGVECAGVFCATAKGQRPPWLRGRNVVRGEKRRVNHADPNQTMGNPFQGAGEK